MKVYCDGFSTTWDRKTYPTIAIAYNSLKEIKEDYESFVEDCKRFGEHPADIFVYVGTPSGDEDKYGYPDYPDYILKVGKRGGIFTEKA